MKIVALTETEDDMTAGFILQLLLPGPFLTRQNWNEIITQRKGVNDEDSLN